MLLKQFIISDFLSKIGYQTYLSFACMIIGILLIKQLRFWHRFIVLIFGWNVAADLASNYFSLIWPSTHSIYNIMVPIEMGLILYLDKRLTFNSKSKKFNLISIFLVITASTAEFQLSETYDRFHFYSIIFSYFLVAFSSYLLLKQVMLKEGNIHSLSFWFALANLIYFSLAISALSSVKLFLLTGEKAKAMMMVNINYAAYSLWALTLLFGMIWTRKRI